MTDPKAPVAEAVPEPENAELAQQQPSEDDQADDSDDAPGDDKEGEKKPELTAEQKTIRKLERRIDKLTAQKGELSRAAERELAELRQQLAQKGDAEDETETPTLTRDEFERLANERAKELRKQETVSEKVATVLKLGKKIDGFDAAVNALADEVPFVDRGGRPTAFIAAVLDSESPAEVLHYLGENPDEAAEYVGLSDAQIGRRLARLEDKLKRSATAKKSAAPTPLKPVKGAAAVTADEQQMTDKAWAAARLKAKLAG